MAKGPFKEEREAWADERRLRQQLEREIAALKATIEEQKTIIKRVSDNCTYFREQSGALKADLRAVATTARTVRSCLDLTCEHGTCITILDIALASPGVKKVMES